MKNPFSNLNPHFSPGRLLLAETRLLLKGYGSIPAVSPLQTTLEAPSLVFFALAGTCSLNQMNNFAFGREYPLTQKIRRDLRITW